MNDKDMWLMTAFPVNAKRKIKNVSEISEVIIHKK